jgi:hypothetical protein
LNDSMSLITLLSRLSLLCFPKSMFIMFSSSLYFYSFGLAENPNCSGNKLSLKLSSTGWQINSANILNSFVVAFVSFSFTRFGSSASLSLSFSAASALFALKSSSYLSSALLGL